MSLSEAFEATVTHAEAICEVLLHGAEPDEFYEVVGRKEAYAGEEVMAYLGY